MNLIQLSARQLIEKIKTKELSSLEVMQAHLTHIAQVNPALNAIVQQLPVEEALEQARQADEAVAKKRPLGKLHGLPITVKNCCRVKGFSPNLGSTAYRDQLSQTDATAVARLKAEGAIVLGITNVPEFMLTFETDNDLYGRTNNPHDLARTPGGSSGGEAAIIAAGGSSLGLASDAAGSIRQPAHNTGIAGLKPTQGLIPKTGAFPADAVGLVRQVATYGPMARYVDDLILALPILAGVDDCDPYVAPVPLKNPEQVELASLRVAFYTDNGIATPTADTCQTLTNVLHLLEKEVYSLEEKQLPGSKDAYNLMTEVFLLDADRGRGFIHYLDTLGLKKPSASVRTYIKFSNQVDLSVTELRNRLLAVDQVRMAMRKFVSSYDLIICPVASTPALLHGALKDNWNNFSYTPAYNFSGWPVAVVRCGTSSDGLPIGLQFIAKPWRDDVALAVAKKVETLLGGWKALTVDAMLAKHKS